MGALNLLLDTCAFLWLAASPERISPGARTALDNDMNSLFLSDVSIWEIVLKHAAGRLPLPAAPRSWMAAQTAFFQLRRLAVELPAVYLSGELPPAHRDPFDRLLAAQALSSAMSIVSPDRPFSGFGCTVIW